MGDNKECFIKAKLFDYAYSFYFLYYWNFNQSY